MKIEMVVNSKALKAIKRELAKKIKVGYLKDDGEHEIPSPLLASILHNGNEEVLIPPRPFFSNFKNNYKMQIESGLKLMAVKALQGESGHSEAGHIFKTNLRKAIEDYKFGAGMINKDNTKSTIKQKGFNKVLTEEGFLVEGVDFETVNN